MTANLSKREQNRQAKEARILSAAMKVFAESGFAGSSMDMIAVAAGTTKPTLYQYFPSKDELFYALMTQERDHMLEIFEHPTNAGMVAELYAFSWHYAERVMRPEMLSIARLIIAEAQRLPEIGRAYQASGPERVLAGMMTYLTSQRDAGRIAFDDEGGLVAMAGQHMAVGFVEAGIRQAAAEPAVVRGFAGVEGAVPGWR